MLRCVLPVVALVVAAPGSAAAVFLDAVLADVNGTADTASDVAVARALSLFGMEPSSAPIRADDVRRLVDARLMEAEAARLEIAPPPADVEDAWRAAADRLGGMEILRRWMDQTGLDEGWARSLVEADLRRRRFVELRFRAFVFITDEEVERTLGPGPHTPEKRAQAVKALEEAAVAREATAWLAEARARAIIRYADIGEAGIPVPIPMPAPAAP